MRVASARSTHFPPYTTSYLTTNRKPRPGLEEQLENILKREEKYRLKKAEEAEEQAEEAREKAEDPIGFEVRRMKGGKDALIATLKAYTNPPEKGISALKKGDLQDRLIARRKKDSEQQAQMEVVEG
jgi:hypothetical protein